MRCTKCSFISFDDLSACAKCATDLSHLSQELNGTCTETRQEFFLGSAIQTPGLDEDNFSDSQMLPPINQGDMNFDDTSTGGFSPLSATSSEATDFGFDDSVSLDAEDDVAIELGDIMPIDFEQLDSGSVLSEGNLEHTDALAFDNLSDSPEKVSDLDLTANLGESDTDFQFSDDLSDIDIGDLSQDLPVVSADANTLSFDETLPNAAGAFKSSENFDIDRELFEQLTDDSGSFDETTTLNPEVGFNETKASNLTIGDADAASLDLDESLVAELAGPSSQDLSEEFPMGYSDDQSASGDFELDEALVAELASGEDGVANSAEDAFSATESISADTLGIDGPLEFAHASTVNEAISFEQIEDLTGDFPAIREEDDAALSGLDLADIDVSDLLDASDRVPASDADNVENPPLVDLSGIDEPDIDALPEGLDLPEGHTPQDFSASLNDTYREGLTANLPLASSDADSADDLGEELVLDDVGQDDLPVDIDVLALDADFEAFLNKTAPVEKLPEIELITDDDDEDVPPDLPR